MTGLLLATVGALWFPRPAFANPIIPGDTKLTAGEATPKDLFGNSVALLDGTVVVGAPGTGGSGHAGSAYIFRINRFLPHHPYP